MSERLPAITRLVSLGLRSTSLTLIVLSVTIGVVAAQVQSGDEMAPPLSPTYPDTLKLLRAWQDAPDNDDKLLANLFATGDARKDDLKAACDMEDRETRGKAYFLLHLLGSPETRKCADQLRFEDPLAMLSISDELSEHDYRNLEQFFRTRRCEKSLSCSSDDLPLIDESLIYALVLDGSKRSSELLGRIASLAKASHSEDNIGFDTAVRSQSVARQARVFTHSLQLDSSVFEESLRRSVFFVPDDQRADAEIRLLARNRNDSRMLVEVSYICGRLCGSGYYVVLQKNASGTWDYALIVRAWIS